MRTSPANGFKRRQLLVSGTLAIAAVALRATPARADANPEISTTEESIHQERVFAASPERVYEALTVEKQFDRVVQLSGVDRQSPTQLSAQEGGPFRLFGGYIVGRQLELVPNQLIVQAWRVTGWPSGAYSIARFELADQAGNTKLVFDHTAFPKGQASHLVSGWQEHYWDPLTKLLA